MSVRVAKGVSYRVGAHRGTFVPGPEVIKVVDDGTAIVTTQRGCSKGREWLFSKLIGIDHSTGSSSSMLHVSNRQKTSGLVYGEDAADVLRFRMDLAPATHSSELGDLIAELKADLAAIEGSRPPPLSLEPGSRQVCRPHR